MFCRNYPKTIIHIFLVITIISSFSYFLTNAHAQGEMSLQTTEAVQIGDGEGEAIITPWETAVGTFQDYKIYFTSGASGISRGGSIRIDLPTCSSFHGLPKNVNWSQPQIDDSVGKGFVNVVSISKVDVNIESSEHPESKNHSYRIKIMAPMGLQPGESIVVQYTHARAQKIQQVAYFRIYTDIDGDGISQPINNPPAVSVTGGPARWIRAVIPSVSVPGEGFDLKVAILDAVGFPAQDYLGTIRFSSNGILKNLPDSYTFTAEDHSAHIFQGVSFEKPGVFVIRVADDSHRSVSNACRVRPGPPPYRLYWGDIHWHSNLSDGLRSPEEGYLYARDVALLDFTAMMDHDTFLEKRDLWPIGCDIANQFYQPGEFVTFCGYEWTSASALEGGYGHRNVYFAGDHGPLFSSLNPLSSRPDDLWKQLEGQNAITIPHHVARSAAAIDWSYLNNDMEPSVEIFSNHGNGEFYGALPPFYEGAQGHYVQDALSMGHKLGFIASTDSHYTIPGGNQYIVHFNEWQGIPALVAVYAPELTRESLFEQLKSRHTYATTGRRILLKVVANDSFIMGDEFTTPDPPEFKVDVAAGNSVIDKVEIIRDNETIYTIQPKSHGCEFKFTDNEYATFLPDTTHYYYVKVTLGDIFSLSKKGDKYPHQAWSSPIWIKKR